MLSDNINYFFQYFNLELWHLKSSGKCSSKFFYEFVLFFYQGNLCYGLLKIYILEDS